MHGFISSVIKKKHVAWLWLVASRGARGAQNIWPWTRAGFLGFVWSKYHMSSLWGALGIHGPYKASLNIIEPFACEEPSVEKCMQHCSSPSAKAYRTYSYGTILVNFPLHARCFDALQCQVGGCEPAWKVPPLSLPCVQNMNPVQP